MVQLSQSPYHRLSTEKSMKLARQEDGSPPSLNALPVALSSVITPYQAYETYIDNGLICLKHKIRNIEKKKIKLEDYRDRMHNGDPLNPDQLEAVEKYDEILHNLEFAKELQKTFSALSQDLLKAQKKILRRDSVIKLEAEKKKLCTVFQVQYILTNFGQELVQKDFRKGLNGAMCLTSNELDYLIHFSKLTCPKRDECLRPWIPTQLAEDSLRENEHYSSLEDQMEQLSLHFWDLLEGSDRTVAGTTYKNLKDLLARLLDCGYFESIPAHAIQEKLHHKEDIEKKPEEIVKKPETPSKMQTVKSPEVPVKCMQSNDIHPCEFLNRRYLPEADYVKNDLVKTKPWVSEYIGKPQPPQSWNKNADCKADEPKMLQPPPPAQTTPKPKRPSNFIPKEQPCEVCVDIKLPSPLQGQQSSVQAQQVPKQRGIVTLLPKESLRQNVELPPKERRGRQPKLGSEMSQSVKVVNQLAAEFCSGSSLPSDPVLRRQQLQDLMTTIQGTYNFMQDSILDFDGLSQSETVPSLQILASPPAVFAVPKEEIQPDQCDSPPGATQICLGTIKDSNEALVADDDIDLITETDLSATKPVAQPVLSLPDESPNFAPPKALYTASPDMSETEEINEETSKVFKVNAPLPPRKEFDMKEESPFPTNYSQSFTTTSTQTTPQNALQPAPPLEQTFLQESLSGPGAPDHMEGSRNQRQKPKEDHDTVYQTDGPIQLNNGNVTFYPAQTNAFARNTTTYLNCRGGTVRGATRSGRALTNSYRSPSGYKGFDGYRGPQSITNGNCGQPPYSREYPGVQFVQRDGSYQPCYKRGSSGGQRANSRGWSDSSQVSSPERDHETFNGGDSGQGDSRNLTPMDIPVTSHAATILPVHVYPLPQQMRVAFSAARTSNFAPGTLDQPIAFDLLLNNLGETFDIHIGRFACPVNGTYVFIFHMLKLAVNVPLYVNLMKNEEVLVSAYANDGAPDHETASNHAVLQLFQGDQIWLRLHRGAIYGSSWKYSTFSGYLLYQD
ncbi:caprin-2 isoform X3 [Ambystoma mexicanum]|uniref:caprin-2 isoform X3 n=1 Tax=Ambystoma mexicanum TaxID=8296 RepID=UPI0037E828B8